MSEAETEVTEKKKTEVTQVQLTDGRTVEFAGKRKMLKNTLIDGNQVVLRVDFRNGETRTYNIPQDMNLQFAGHGAEQKYGDEAAGLEDIDDIILAMDELDVRIQKGEWSVRREGTGLAGASVLLQALIQHSVNQGKPKTKEEVKAFLGTKSMAEKQALRQSKQLKPIIDEIEAKKAKPNVDTDALLSELG